MSAPVSCSVTPGCTTIDVPPAELPPSRRTPLPLSNELPPSPPAMVFVPVTAIVLGLVIATAPTVMPPSSCSVLPPASVMVPVPAVPEPASSNVLPPWTVVPSV